VALVRTDISEERSATFIRVTRIGELGTTLIVTSNRRMLQRNAGYDEALLGSTDTPRPDESDRLWRGTVRLHSDLHARTKATGYGEALLGSTLTPRPDESARLWRGAVRLHRHSTPGPCLLASRLFPQGWSVWALSGGLGGGGCGFCRPPHCRYSSSLLQSACTCYPNTSFYLLIS
jgi:hypothetical protein